MTSEIRSSQTYARLCLAAAILVVLQIVAHAQSSNSAARPDRGVRPNGSYGLSDIESISMTNGNLNLSIPLASLPPIAGSKLSWTVNAVYNGKLWDIMKLEDVTDLLGATRFTKDKIQASDFGGWRVGRAYEIVSQKPDVYDFDWLGPDPGDAVDVALFNLHPYHTYAKVQLITPDGTTHELRPLDYLPYSGIHDFLWSYYWQTPDTISPAAPMRYYSIDGSYIWAEIQPAGGSTLWDVYLPDGMHIKQKTSFQRIIDTNNNSITITSVEGPPGTFVTHYADDQATGSVREILVSGSIGTSQQIQYQTANGSGSLATIDISWVTTSVHGKVYTLEDKVPNTNSTCTRPDLFGSLPISVLRDITLPQTEAGLPRKKFTFTYNSEAPDDNYTQTWSSSCGGNPIQITSASHGWGELSQMVMPSSTTVNYIYDMDSKHRLFETGIENNDLPRGGMITKSVSHDGITDTWGYGHGSVQGGVTGPDGSSTLEHTYTTDPAFSALYGGPGLGSLSYKTERFLNGFVNVTTERHWTRFLFDGGSDLQPGTANVAPFNAVVDAEYTTLHNSSGVATKMNAKTYVHDYNGNVTSVTEYDWFDPGIVQREGGTVNLPVGPPASATKLRVTNSSYHSQADTSSSTNVYAKRVSGSPPSPFILNAVKETTVGNGTSVLSTSRVHYDLHNFGGLPTAGNVTLERRDNSGVWIDVSHTYDVQGNRLTTTDPKLNVTTFVYGDATHAQPTSIKVDPNNQVMGDELTTLISYDYYTGLVKTQTDPNGNVSTTDYTNQSLNAVDPFGRPGKVTGPYVSVNITGQVSTQRRTAVTKYFDNALQMETFSDLNAENDGKLKSRTTVDQLGRAIKSERSEDGSTYSVSSETVYKNKPGGLNGSVAFTRNPHRSGSDPTDGWTRATQDAMGRTTEVATFAGATQPPETGTTGSGVTWTGSVTTSYNVEQTTATDQAGKQRRSIVDGLGRLKTVVEDPTAGGLNYSTNYFYDALGNLFQVDQGTQHRYFTYDNLSRLKTAKNPEQVDLSGNQATTSYAYDDSSNLLTKTTPVTDTSNFVVTFTYDGINRVLTKLLSTGGLWNYAYDTGTNGKGKLVSVVKSGSTDGNYYDGYDAMGRVSASHQITTTTQSGAQSYTMSYGYDLAGNNTSQVYPSGKEIRTVFDGAGRVTAARRYISSVFDRTYASQFQYAPHGGVISLALGNNTAETMQFNSRYQPTTIELRKSDNTLILGLDYTYGTTSSNNGNIGTQAIRIGNAGTTTTINQSYGYDNLNRLHTASESGSWSQTYDFDQYGNRWVSQSTGYTVSATLCPTHSTDISTVTNRLLLPGFSYDFGGNQKTQTRNSQTENYAYDSENHLVSINTGSIGSYVYDGDGRRVRKTDASGTTVFVYNAGGQLIAEYQSDPVSSPSGGGGTSYLTSDHLGSTRVVMNQDATVKARYDYLPFGEELGSSIGQRTGGMGYSAADSTKQKFTRKERDAESGLDYFLARYYSSAQGRFTSPDEFAGGPDELFDFADSASDNPTFYADLHEPQSLNKYQYCYNNPLAYIDPDGHGLLSKLKNAARSAVETSGEFVGGVIRGAAASISIGYAPGSAPRDDDSIASRLGQAVGTAVVIVAGEQTAGAGLVGGIVSSPTVAGAVVGGTAVVAGVGAIAGGLVNAGRVVTTPIHRKGGTDDRAGKDFTQKGKQEVIEQNKAANNGVTTCQNCGNQTVAAQKSQPGVKPPRNETQVDHRIPKSRGGKGRPDNGQVLCRGCNRAKSNKLPNRQ